MQLLVEGNAGINGKNQIGGAVFDQSQIVFFHKPLQKGQMVGSATGGLLGALIGMGIQKMIDKRKEKKGGPEKVIIDSEPFFARWDEGVQKKLAGVEIYTVVPRDHISNIQETFAGFAFSTGAGEHNVKAKIKKKKMREFMMENGYNVPMA